MTDQPSLADAILTAADTQEALNKRVGYDADIAWTPSKMRRIARRIAVEDQEDAEWEAMVDELARDLLAAQSARYPDRQDLRSWDAPNAPQINCRALAASLIASGWRKDPAS